MESPQPEDKISCQMRPPALYDGDPSPPVPTPALATALQTNEDYNECLSVCDIKIYVGLISTQEIGMVYI